MARFIEGHGGAIWGPNGEVAVRVQVENMLTAEAVRMTKAVIAALETEFPNPSMVNVKVRTDDIGQQVADAVKAATPGIIKATKDSEP